MTSKSEPNIQVLDKRRVQTFASQATEFPAAPNARNHAVLLGYLSEDHTRGFLERKGFAPDLLTRAMQHRQRAIAAIKELPALRNKKSAAQPLQNDEALSEIARVMSRPERKSAYPDGSWTAQLVEIASIIPVHPALDLNYALDLGETDLGPSNLLAAVKLCFAERNGTEFDVRVDQRQKAVTIHGINPTLEVVGLQYERKRDGGPALVVFMVSPAPNIVTVSHCAGRYFLSDGWHRVFRLMKAGYTEVPCAVREVGNLAEARAYSPEPFDEETLMAPRPPLFSDFADPMLAVPMPFPAVRRAVRIRPDEYFLPV